MKPESHLPPIDYEAQHPVLANPGETRSLDHLPQLDGIRAIAVLMVMWSHFMPASFHVSGGPPWGAIGVGTFFTLSGFLITRILLNGRAKITAGANTFWTMTKQFYARRFLRIFPLYYAVLILLFIFNPAKFRHRALWDFLYLTNVRFAYWPRAGGEMERHLWSLSVEEQFYLIWPVLMLLTPRKLLLPLILLTIAVAPFWRVYMYVPKFLIHEWMMPGCIDMLGAGALLALLSLPQYGWSRWRDAFVQLCGIVGVPLLIAFCAQRMHALPAPHHKWVTGGFDLPALGGLTYPMTALAATWFVGTAARGFRGPIGWFLTFAPIVYIGRISYGLYVIHMFVPWTLAYFFPATFNKDPEYWWHFWLFVSLSVALASLSWFALEAPMNRLKRYFEYDKSVLTSAPISA